MRCSTWLLAALACLAGCAAELDSARTRVPPAPQAVHERPRIDPVLAVSSGMQERVLSARRLAVNPIIHPHMLPGKDGENIDGPSLIRVPDWVENPLGRYYLYFAHHLGDYIRLAYADSLEGPWQIFAPGTLRLDGTVCDDVFGPGWIKRKHIASPDVHVEEQSREIRMYFHCPAYVGGPETEDSSYKQVSFVASSRDGLNFKVQPLESGTSLGQPFFRVFKWSDSYYAIAMPGVFYRSADGIRFEKGPTLFPKEMRHSAVAVRGDTLHVFYSEIGAAPESILVSSIPLTEDWMEWKASDSSVVLKPEYDWEGTSAPLEASRKGPVFGPAHQLRDPAIFVEDGRTYLLYSVAGEFGIGIAELHWH